MAGKEPIELGTGDISEDWTVFLAKLYDLGVGLKVPGRKAKGNCLFKSFLIANCYSI